MSYLTLVDLSEWNGPTGGKPRVDFNKLKDNVDGFILKASGGDGKTVPLYRDAELTYNQEQARATGRPVGYYHFAGGGDPVKEADYFLAQIGELEPGEFIADDFEISHTNPGSWCGQFYNRLHDKTMVWAMQYSPRALMAQIYQHVPQAGLWVADPDDPPGGTVMYPAGHPVSYTYIMQQFITTGTKPGVQGFVDLNAFFYTGDKTQGIEELKKYGKQVPQPIPIPEPPTSQPSPTPASEPTPEPTPTPDPTSTPTSGTAVDVVNKPTVVYPKPSPLDNAEKDLGVVEQLVVFMQGKKSFTLGIFMVLLSVEKYITGQETLSQFLTTVQGLTGLNGLAVITIRSALAKLRV